MAAHYDSFEVIAVVVRIGFFVVQPSAVAWSYWESLDVASYVAAEGTAAVIAVIVVETHRYWFFVFLEDDGRTVELVVALVAEPVAEPVVAVVMYDGLDVFDIEQLQSFSFYRHLREIHYQWV